MFLTVTVGTHEWWCFFSPHSPRSSSTWRCFFSPHSQDHLPVHSQSSFPTLRRHVQMKFATFCPFLFCDFSSPSPMCALEFPFNKTLNPFCNLTISCIHSNCLSVFSTLTSSGLMYTTPTANFFLFSNLTSTHTTHSVWDLSGKTFGCFFTNSPIPPLGLLQFCMFWTCHVYPPTSITSFHCKNVSASPNTSKSSSLTSS